MKDNVDKNSDVKLTDLLNSYLLCLTTDYKSCHLFIEELCSENCNVIEKFGLVMNVKRFFAIVSMIKLQESNEERLIALPQFVIILKGLSKTARSATFLVKMQQSMKGYRPSRDDAPFVIILPLN